MFLLFINDIHENLDSTLRLFADDAILYRSIKTMNDIDILQNDIDKLVSWSKTWQMQFNVTNVILLGYLGRRILCLWIITSMAKSCLP